MNSTAPYTSHCDPEIALGEIQAILNAEDFLYLTSIRVIDLLSNIADARVGNDQLFLDSWNSLEEDQYMADGGRYRKRRHATFATQSSTDTPVLMP